ncbi:MAG: hypothetical protein KAH44_04540, partial [Oricola sp.]|nr:hypothetical protein [Oricola sp.]
VEAITDAALSAVFGLCVPAVSAGVFEQTVSVDMLVPASQEKMIEYGLNPDAENYFLEYGGDNEIFVEVEGGACRVVTGEGDTRRARDEFLKRLKQIGGRIADIDVSDAPPGTIAAEIEITKSEMVVISFYAGDEKTAAGFYASAFRVLKQG